jgi:hypothetical protein
VVVLSASALPSAVVSLASAASSKLSEGAASLLVASCWALDEAASSRGAAALLPCPPQPKRPSAESVVTTASNRRKVERDKRPQLS